MGFWRKKFGAIYRPEYAVFILGFVFVVSLRLISGPGVCITDGQSLPISSENFQQVVSIVDLRDNPVSSLFFLHIQPPALDTIRAVLALPLHFAEDAELLKWVDRELFVVWALIYAATGTLIFVWGRRLMSRNVAAVMTLLFLIHPPLIAYTTLLDSTILTSFLILWFFYELWRLEEGEGSIYLLAAATLVLFFTRSIFQWPVLIVLAATLLLLKLPMRKILTFMLITGLVFAAFTFKQYMLFRVTYTSTFAGINCNHAMGLTTDPFEPVAAEFSDPDLAAALSRTHKLNGDINFNNIDYVAYAKDKLHDCESAILRQPPSRTLEAFQENFSIYRMPSSYCDFNITHSLPWRGIYERIFSGYQLFFILLVAAAWWLFRNYRRWMSGIALALPLLYIMLISVMFERGEDMRYRFFVEPVLYLFIFTQLISMVHWAYDKVAARLAASGD